MKGSELSEIVSRVVDQTTQREMENEGWERAIAINGLLAVDQELDTAQKLMDRAVATQTTEGNFAYGWGDSPGEWAAYATYDVSDYKPTLNSSPLAYPALEWYDRTSEEKYLDAVTRQYELFESIPRTEDGGISRQLNDVELFTECLYFLCPFVTRYGNITDSPDRIEEATTQARIHIKRLRDQQSGLFRHIWRETPNSFPASSFWARANGWATAGLVDTLAELPATHPDRDFLLGILEETMAALLEYQDRSGFWRQRIDDSTAPLETSGTLMFVYTIRRGQEFGLFTGSEFETAAEDAMTACMGIVDAQGNVRRVSQPPASADSPLGVTTYGQGWFLLAASCFLESEPTTS